MSHEEWAGFRISEQSGEVVDLWRVCGGGGMYVGVRCMGEVCIWCGGGMWGVCMFCVGGYMWGICFCVWRVEGEDFLGELFEVVEGKSKMVNWASSLRALNRSIYLMGS